MVRRTKTERKILEYLTEKQLNYYSLAKKYDYYHMMGVKDEFFDYEYLCRYYIMAAHDITEIKINIDKIISDKWVKGYQGY